MTRLYLELGGKGYIASIAKIVQPFFPYIILFTGTIPDSLYHRHLHARMHTALEHSTSLSIAESIGAIESDNLDRAISPWQISLRTDAGGSAYDLYVHTMSALGFIHRCARLLS